MASSAAITPSPTGATPVAIGSVQRIVNAPTSASRESWVKNFRAGGSTGTQREPTEAPCGAGKYPSYIARQLGHTNANMLFRVYSKWIDGADKSREREKLNVGFGHDLATD